MELLHPTRKRSPGKASAVFASIRRVTVGHLLFAVLITAYVLAGTRLEERTLVQVLEDDYRRYQASTPMLIPRLQAGVSRAASPATTQSEAL